MKKLVLLITLATLGLSSAVWLVLDKDPGVPVLEGTLIFHRYSSYSAWDSQLMSLDLSSGELTQINLPWKSVISPINAHPNAHGDVITFMGSQAGLGENEWDVFTSAWDGSQWGEPKNLTGPNGKRDEDPKFSPDGTLIIYKEDGVLATIASSGGRPTYLTSGEPESSMPYFVENGRDILFEREGSIFLKTPQGLEKMNGGAGVSSYYPIAVDGKKFLFSRVQESRHDWIYWGYFDGAKAQPLFFNSNSWDSSDSFPYEKAERYIFFVSGDFSIPKGGYNLVVADIEKKKTYSLDDLYGEINTHQEELGPAWTLRSYTFK